MKCNINGASLLEAINRNNRIAGQVHPAQYFVVEDGAPYLAAFGISGFNIRHRVTALFSDQVGTPLPIPVNMVKGLTLFPGDISIDFEQKTDRFIITVVDGKNKAEFTSLFDMPHLPELPAMETKEVPAIITASAKMLADFTAKTTYNDRLTFVYSTRDMIFATDAFVFCKIKSQNLIDAILINQILFSFSKGAKWGAFDGTVMIEDEFSRVACNAVTYNPININSVIPTEEPAGKITLDPAVLLPVLNAVETLKLTADQGDELNIIAKTETELIQLTITAKVIGFVSIVFHAEKLKKYSVIVRERLR